MSYFVSLYFQFDLFQMGEMVSYKKPTLIGKSQCLTMMRVCQSFSHFLYIAYKGPSRSGFCKSINKKQNKRRNALFDRPQSKITSPHPATEVGPYYFSRAYHLGRYFFPRIKRPVPNSPFCPQRLMAHRARAGSRPQHSPAPRRHDSCSVAAGGPVPHLPTPEAPEIRPLITFSNPNFDQPPPVAPASACCLGPHVSARIPPRGVGGWPLYRPSPKRNYAFKGKLAPITFSRPRHAILAPLQLAPSQTMSSWPPDFIIYVIGEGPLSLFHSPSFLPGGVCCLCVPSFPLRRGEVFNGCTIGHSQ